MRYLSVCSGIEAATVAWHPLGWEPLAFSEIEPFPCAVLKHHYPNVPNLGDMTAYGRWPALAPDLLVGGTPCQSFSVSGLRKGMADPRGNLALVFLGLVDRFRPRWVVWENVPGVRSADDGRALGAFLGGLGELGYGWAYRSLDAQYFGLAQRRERVFVVGHSGGWTAPAAVLFEPESLRGDSAPRRDTGERVAPTIASRPTGDGGLGTDFDCDGGVIVTPTLSAQYGEQTGQDYMNGFAVVFNWQNGGGYGKANDGLGIGIEQAPPNSRSQVAAVAYAIQGPAIDENPANGPDGMGVREEIAYTITATSKVQAVAYGAPIDTTGHQGDKVVGDGDVWPCLAAHGANNGGGAGERLHHHHRTAVRRLTPRECERLQGFPDDYTLVPYRGRSAADGPRYKALGNSMAVPVMRWIGERIVLVEDVLRACVRDIQEVVS